MTLKEAVNFLKGAVARSMPGGAASVYTVYNGRLYAQNPAVLASYPVPHMQDLYSLAADDLEGVLDRMPSEPILEAGDDTLILKSGRLRSSIQLMEADEPSTTYENVATENLPNGLMDAFATVLPFVSKEGTWQRGVRVEPNRVIAINNRSSIELTIPDFSPSESLIIPSECVAYLTKLDAPNTVHFAGNYSIFGWSNTAWVRCQALIFEWPALVDKVLNSADDATPLIITEDWHASFDDVASLGDGRIEIRPEGIFGKSAFAQHDVEFDTGVKRTTYWSMDALKPVFETATNWNPDAQGPARFIGPNLRGIVIGQRK